MNKKRAALLLTTIFFVLISAVPALAWDEVGHKLTAYIAWQRMKPEVREKVFQILMQAPEDSDLSTPYDRFNSRSEEAKRLELFMYASIWADVVRNRAFEVRNSKYDQGNWHYAAIFWQQENGMAVRLPGFRGSGGIAVEKLEQFEKIMRGPSYRADEKALAIAWFLHVGGDLHNPLHNASRVTALEPDGDQGGNMFVFVPRTEDAFGVNLHSYWDSIIGRVKPRRNDACDLDYLSPIARKFIKKHKFRKLEETLKLGEYRVWNEEGYELLSPVVYNNIERGSMPSRKYRKRAYKTAREKIVLAGYRIGETLNRILAKDSG